MAEALHIFKKDLRYLWREICLMLGLTTAYGWIGTLGRDLLWVQVR